MNFLTKLNLWGMQAMKAVRYMRFSEFVHNEDRLIESGNKKACDKVGNPGVDAIACIVPNTDAGKALHDPAVSIYMNGTKKTETKTEKDLLQHLKMYLIEEINYHKSLQMMNKKAIKRIKKILRKM
ncbi:hypothetical protein HW555_001781 [Spodoptera exigua]|uniref:Uncharacterized protein n=1 Tax=Spodoptera exigua TaxID=7107 RepID=A0A835L7N6_SPOEX|nr:hypothetical protein HW555_001781 [Spodoptera exigua]